MRIYEGHRRRLLLVGAVAAVLAAPIAAAGQSKIYPPGTDCANQPTIAERLLCGRQEFRRQQGLSVDQPSATQTPPPAVDEDRPFPDQPTRPAEIRPAPEELQYIPRTSSPNH